MYTQEYPALALKTEGTYEYVKAIWRRGRLEKWRPADNEPGFNTEQLLVMRYQHAVTGINTECSELMQLFIGDYLSTLDAPLEKIEVIKELGDIMWYVNLAFQALLTFNILTSDKIPVSQSAVIRFTDYVNNAHRIAQGMNCRVLPTTMMDLSVSAQHAGNLLLKWMKNTCYYGQVRDNGEIETQLCLIIMQVAKIARLLGSDIVDVLGINIEKLKRRYPEGFNGEDAVAQKDEAPGYKSISDQTVWNASMEDSKELDKVLLDSVLATNDAAPAVGSISNFAREEERQGLIIDGTFDQSALPEPGDKSDLAVLEAKTAAQQKFNAHLEASSALVATWPAWKQSLLGGAIKSVVTQIDSLVGAITHESQPQPNPQADLEARARALTQQDIVILESSVNFIKKLHEDMPVTVSEHELVNHFSRIVRGLGWQQSEAPAPVENPNHNPATCPGCAEYGNVASPDKSGNLPPQPLS